MQNGHFLKSLIYLSLFIFSSLLVACGQSTKSGIGYQQITISDSATEAQIDVTLWYPTDELATGERIGQLTADLAIDAAPKQSKGLILLSHGFAGDSLSHSDTAIHLAQNGFLVAAPTHPDLAGVEADNPQNDPLVMRPRVISLLLDQILHDEAFGNTFEPQNVGIIGYSIGSYTALTAMGGQPSFDALGEYCSSVPSDEILCADWAEARFGAIDNLIDSKQDTQIQAAVLLAPAYGPLFNKQSLETIDSRVKIYQAEHDEELAEPYHAEHLISALPQQPEHEMIADAGHYVFLAPCSNRLKRTMPQFCNDADGVDREATHEQMNTGIVQFFSEVFD